LLPDRWMAINTRSGMILLAFLVDSSFMVRGSCFTKVFLVPEPLVEQHILETAT